MLEIDSEKEVKDQWWLPGMLLFINVIGWVAGPVIIALLVGRWLDDKYQTSPWILLIFVFVAFVFSIIGIVKETNKTIKQIEGNKKEEKKEVSKK